MPVRVAIVDSHPIQYHVPWYRALAELCELEVLYAHAQTSSGQARAGYGVAFDWDIDLRSGYAHRFLHNVAPNPGVGSFGSCDTPELAEQLDRSRYDAVVTTGWYLKSYVQAVFASKKHGLPVLVRGDSQRNPSEALAKRAVRRVTHGVLLSGFDGFLSVGSRNRAYLRHYGVPDARIFFSPHVIDTARFREASALSSERRHALRAELGVGPDERLVLQVGRLIDWKRPLDLIAAIAHLGEPRERFVAGYVGAGSLESTVRDEAAQRSVRARMLGFRNQSELPRLYAAADLLVLASDARETWGLVVNEAFACGLPALVSEAAGCAPDLIDPGRSGDRFACGDVAALARALHTHADLRARPEAQQRLRELTDTRSPDAAARLTLQAIERVIANRSAT